MWHLLGYTGMRRGELLGLRWRDVDLTAGTIRVQRGGILTSTQVAYWTSLLQVACAGNAPTSPARDTGATVILVTLPRWSRVGGST